MKSLVWLRKDLRIDDNPALINASIENDLIHCVYLHSNEQNKIHNEANVKIDFFIKNLKSLSEKLSHYKIGITIIYSDNFQSDPAILENFMVENNFEKLFFNKCFGQDENNRDDKVKIMIEKNNFHYEEFNDQIIYETGFLKTADGRPFSVFSPFKRRWIENFKMEFLDIDKSLSPNTDFFKKSNIDEFDFKFTKKHHVNDEMWGIGEDHALSLLKVFLSNAVNRYQSDRNDPIIDGTSRISPYLASGIISSKRCIFEAIKLNNFELDSGNKGIVKWVDEIIWREFYRNIMDCFPKVGKNQPFQDYTKNVSWRFDESEFNSWKAGMTGFPIIDAAMRQLQKEGWMHNRLRMVTAMFFSKNMLHDWRIGEQFFMENLIDGDFASNNGGWQWSASTGTDAAPYFRIFNPITQSNNFDKEGLFIKKYVPELSKVDKKEIHDPSEKIRDYCGYPNKILDLKQSRLRAIEAFNSAKN